MKTFLVVEDGQNLVVQEHDIYIYTFLLSIKMINLFYFYIYPFSYKVGRIEI